MAGLWTCDFLKLKSLSAKKKQKTHPKVEVYLTPRLHLQLPVYPQGGLSWQVDFCWRLKARVMHYVVSKLLLSLLGLVMETRLMKLLGDTTLQIFDMCSLEWSIQMPFIIHRTSYLVAYLLDEQACFLSPFKPCYIVHWVLFWPVNTAQYLVADIRCASEKRGYCSLWECDLLLLFSCLIIHKV